MITERDSRGRIVKNVKRFVGEELLNHRRKIAREDYWRNVERKRFLAKQSYLRHKEERLNKVKERWKNLTPWEKTFRHIMTRCVYDKGKKYYEKGIKVDISISDLKTIWFRDKAYDLKRPSIDRINPLGDYTFNNCRYVELDFNSRRKASRKLLKCSVYACRRISRSLGLCPFHYHKEWKKSKMC